MRNTHKTRQQSYTRRLLILFCAASAHVRWMIAHRTDLQPVFRGVCVRAPMALSDVTEHQSNVFRIFELCAVCKRLGITYGVLTAIPTALNQFFALLAVGDRSW